VNRLYSALVLGLLSLVLSGCAAMALPLVTGAGVVGAGTLLSERGSALHADECYRITTTAERERVSRAELNRRLMAARCPQP